jgi:arylsulfatase A-like enzyme
MKDKPNILFIIIDALRAKNLGCYGYSKPTSPNIDNLVKEGVMFEKAFSCATTTYPSLTTIFSGKYPLSHGIVKLEEGKKLYRSALRIDETETVFLPEILQSEGYTTMAIDWLGRWLKRGYDYYSGIVGPRQLMLYSLIRKLTVKSFPTSFLLKIQHFLQRHKINAEIITDKAIDLIERNHKKRFFLFLHYWDTHVPYNPPGHHIEKFIDSDYGNDQSVEEVLGQLKPNSKWYLRKRIMSDTKTINEVLARYDGAISYVDAEIGRLIEALKHHGVFDDTFIILTSDHGESLTEHDIYFNHHGLYDVTIHVPLILKHPHFPKNKRVKSLVQHTDITPTILESLGIKNNHFGFDGKSLYPLIYGELDELRDFVFSEEAAMEQKKALRTHEYKYIYAYSEKDAMCKECGYIHGGIQELYDLHEDPDESDNIVEERPDKAINLREKIEDLVKHLQSKKQILIEKEPWEYSDEEEKRIEKRLKDLGYL